MALCPVFLRSCIWFARVDEAFVKFDSLCIGYDPIMPATAYLAGQTFLRYRRGGGPRQHLIPDFLIAAHASVQADRLAAINRGYLRTYFPALAVLSPFA